MDGSYFLCYYETFCHAFIYTFLCMCVLCTYVCVGRRKFGDEKNVALIMLLPTHLSIPVSKVRLQYTSYIPYSKVEDKNKKKGSSEKRVQGQKRKQISKGYKLFGLLEFYFGMYSIFSLVSLCSLLFSNPPRFCRLSFHWENFLCILLTQTSYMNCIGISQLMGLLSCAAPYVTHLSNDSGLTEKEILRKRRNIIV